MNSRRESFDHLVGANKKSVRYGQPECLRGFEIDDEFELRRPHDWQIAGLLALENAPGVDARLAITIAKVSAVTRKAPAAAYSRCS